MSEQNIKPYPGTAAVLSFVVNGLGQIYNGQIIKGLVLVFFSFMGVTVLIISGIPLWFSLLGKELPERDPNFNLALFLMVLVLVGILSIFSIFDAYKVAAKK